ncbi:immunoglobulin-like domain-containing receptor 1b [Alosa sapidissima]|uniref:immunoglobulin-like domain-containing receptor 1b n=1 Tax=Alosa sapidissima TaxID=34773 RepID=UPI001C09EA18|nr:immunoglobulin-like domain-containing receptor 1b [Alosa sapidissima]
MSFGEKMGNLILVVVLLGILPKELQSIQVTVPQTERSTALFASVILRCDYSTSANPSEVLVTWRYKSFCKDPVLEYYSTAYQASLALGQDPANDCPDRQRTVRVVVQKRGTNEPTLGSEYRERKITIQDKADLVINEVMWWDNGVYFCSIDAPGDTTGDSDREIKLIVYHWLTVLFIIIGALLLIMLLCICCCQCCPQNCCCYVRCPCCPQTCCCPEKVVMQHRMLKEAKRAMAPWLHGQPIYAPVSNGSSQANYPLLYPGSVSDYPTKQGIPMGPMGYPPQHQGPPVMSHGIYDNGNVQGSIHGNNQMLDFLESQVRSMDVPQPLVHTQPAPQQMAAHPVQSLPPQHRATPPQAVPFSAGPPSMLSALDEIGVHGMERRVIQLPPIIGRGSGQRSSGGTRGGPRLSNPSSDNSSRGGYRRDPREGPRDPPSPRRGILRSYSDESDWDDRHGRRTGGSGGRRGGGGGGARGAEGYRPRSRSRDDVMDELRHVTSRRDRSYTPPPRRRGSWSSEEEDSRRGGGARPSRGRPWPEKPPSYSSIEIQAGHSSRKNNIDRFSERSSRSGNSVVI